MAPPPAPFNPRSLGRAAVVGAVLAALGIGLFVVLWAALGSAGMANAPRLFASLCVPPAVIALLVGGYALTSRRR